MIGLNNFQGAAGVFGIHLLGRGVEFVLVAFQLGAAGGEYCFGGNVDHVGGEQPAEIIAAVDEAAMGGFLLHLQPGLEIPRAGDGGFGGRGQVGLRLLVVDCGESFGDVGAQEIDGAGDVL